MATYTGTPPTFTAGAELPAATLNAHVRDFINAFGAWDDSWTPQIDQGGTTDIAYSETYAKYLQINKLVICRAFLSVTGSGTSGQPITVTYPVAPAYTGSSLIVMGGGLIRDDTVEYVCSVGSGTAGGGSANFRRADANSTGQVGEDPAFALASGDTISFWAVYEAA